MPSYRFDKRRRLVRKLRIRKLLTGTTDRPRLSIFISNKHISAQLIDDSVSHTLISSSSQQLEVRKNSTATKTEIAKLVGEVVGKKIKAQGYTDIIFDRSGYKYHGRTKQLAEAVREQGLKF